jgi:proteic killer suppression protein
MEIKFTDNKLEKLANDYKKCQMVMGAQRAKLYNIRLGDLHKATTLEETRYLPGNFHELKATRKGQWACDLDQPYRLVFTPIERPIPVNDNGQYSWIEITSVEIIEIINYHKEK